MEHGMYHRDKPGVTYTQLSTRIICRDIEMNIKKVPLSEEFEFRTYRQ